MLNEDSGGNDADDDEWFGFKIVMDNWDKNVKPRYRRIDDKTKSLHFLHHYAVKDRINLRNVSDVPNPYAYVLAEDLPTDILLPSSSDFQHLLKDFAILVSRVLVKRLSYFSSTFSDVVVNHIKHTYYQEMTQKSETVNFAMHFVSNYKNVIRYL
jgi:hypothetical protein